MKVKIDVLVMVAAGTVKLADGAEFDAARFTSAVKGFIGEHADKETVGSRASQSKADGSTFRFTLGQKTNKTSGVVAESVHWLAMQAELAQLAMLDWDNLPEPPERIGHWLSKFVNVPAAVSKP